MNTVNRIINRIIDDMVDRKGFGDIWDELQRDDQKVVIKAWKRIVYIELQKMFDKKVGV